MTGQMSDNHAAPYASTPAHRGSGQVPRIDRFSTVTLSSECGLLQRRWETRHMTGANGSAGPDAGPGRRWDVALSFAGAQRDYVGQVARR